MNKLRLMGVMAGAVILIALGCTTYYKPKEQAGPADLMGTSVWNWMQAQPYPSWQMWPGKSAFYKGTEPHGMLLTTYVNELALAAVRNGTRPLPTGAVIVKENYKPTKELAAVTIMMKSKDYNPDGGDWWWAKYSPDGSVIKEGKVAGCLDCHGMEKGNDYLLTDTNHQHHKHK